MTDDYKLEKLVWDDGDFDQMGWHDATIYGIVFGPGEFELSLDIDYIFEWVHPAKGEQHFLFWVAPCTLVFQNVYDLQLSAEPLWVPALSILSVDVVHRTDPRKLINAKYIGRDVEWQWTLECHNGDLSFWSVGFRQYVRRMPVLTTQQALDLSERGGVSYERPDAKGSA
jgi:hypothetical protein